MDRNESPRSGRGRGTAVCWDGRDHITATTQQDSPDPTPAATLLLTRLFAHFPVLAECRPLAIGIHLALGAAKPGKRKSLLRRICRRRYLEAWATSGPRHALGGSACGEVTGPQREAARAKLDQVPVLGVALLILSLTKPRAAS
jgi:hypothetical protein